MLELCGAEFIVVRGCRGNTGAPEQWSMFSSFMLGGCGLNDWDINSEIVRAVASDPVGPYTMVERVAGPFVSADCVCQALL